MTLIARHPFNSAGRRVLPGEPVPEAAAWKTLPDLLFIGWIEDAPDEVDPAPAPARDPAPRDVPLAGKGRPVRPPKDRP